LVDLSDSYGIINNENLQREKPEGIMSISKVIKKYKLNEQPNDFLFWQSKSYEERLDALEQIRREYNSWRYNAEQGFQRVYRIVKRA
jgi:hypothetical protein